MKNPNENTNMIKKGDRVRLRNGWEGTMFDNMRGNIRMVEVYGFETEIGSVYAHDIVAYMPKSVGGWIVIPMADRSAHLVNVIRSTLV